jgi:hypothetical protein
VFLSVILLSFPRWQAYNCCHRTLPRIAFGAKSLFNESVIVLPYQFVEFTFQIRPFDQGQLKQLELRFKVALNLHGLPQVRQAQAAGGPIRIQHPRIAKEFQQCRQGNVTGDLILAAGRASLRGTEGNRLLLPPELPAGKE